jgi:hypothetical protein
VESKHSSWVFRTSEEPFERWLFYLLRDIGAHIVADDPPKVRQVLGLGASEPELFPKEKSAISRERNAS